MGENQTSPPELYPGYAEEQRRHLERIAAIEAAAREPLPGPLLDAYANVPFEIQGFKIRPLVHYDFVMLTKLDSPLLQQLRGAKETTFSDEQAYEMVWQFSRPARVVADELNAYERNARVANPAATDAEIATAVRAAFRQRALEQVGLSLTFVEAGLLVKAVEREIIRAFTTALKFQPKVAEGANFTAPPPAAATGLAGGSITSPAS